MTSKYDRYWRSRLEEIKNKIEDALQTGYSSELDVSDIRKYGDRKNWGTQVTIPPGVTKITEELSPDAHGKSLGNVIIDSGILEMVEKNLLGRISPREGRLFLHFETDKTTRSFASSVAQMPEEKEIIFIGEPSKEAYTHAVNTLRSIEPQSPFRFGKWKELPETDIRKIAILRICSPQTRVANLRSLEYSSNDMDKLLKDETSEEETLSILRKHGIRFPIRKTEPIRYLRLLDISSLIQEIKELSGTSLNQERAARERVTTAINGMGLKTTSDFLKDIGFSKYLAVLDSRNLRFLQNMGLASKLLKTNELSKRKVYYKLEDIENELAKKVGITVSELDEKIMAYTGEEKPHRI